MGFLHGAAVVRFISNRSVDYVSLYSRIDKYWDSRWFSSLLCEASETSISTSFSKKLSRVVSVHAAARPNYVGILRVTVTNRLLDFKYNSRTSNAIALRGRLLF